MSRAWWRLAALTSALFAVMAALAPPGLPDGRIAGYTPTDVLAFASHPRALAQARQVLRLDMLFPALLAVVLIWPLSRRVLSVPALAYALADYAENITLLRAYGGAGVPDWLGSLTQAKWGLVALAVIVLLADRLVQRRKRSSN